MIPLHRVQFFRDRHLIVGHGCSFTLLYKARDGWTAKRVIETPAAFQYEIPTHWADGSIDHLLIDFFAISAEGLRMDDFGDLFGAELGNGRVPS